MSGGQNVQVRLCAPTACSHAISVRQTGALTPTSGKPRFWVPSMKCSPKERAV